jgi:endonuclease YncB( thermonuclease family)
MTLWELRQVLAVEGAAIGAALGRRAGDVAAAQVAAELADATPDLLAAEEQARSNRIGIWRR